MRVKSVLYISFLLLLYGCDTTYKEIPPDLLSEYNVSLLSRNWLLRPTQEHSRQNHFVFALGNNLNDLENPSTINRVEEISVGSYRRKVNYYFSDGKLIKKTNQKNRNPIMEYEYLYDGDRIVERKRTDGNYSKYRGDSYRYEMYNDTLIVTHKSKNPTMTVFCDSITNKSVRGYTFYHHIDTFKYNAIDQLLWKKSKVIQEDTGIMRISENTYSYNSNQNLEFCMSQFTEYVDSLFSSTSLDTYKYIYDENGMLINSEHNTQRNGHISTTRSSSKYRYGSNLFSEHLIRESYDKDNHKVGHVKFYLDSDNKINEIERYTKEDYMYSGVKQIIYYE